MFLLNSRLTYSSAALFPEHPFFPKLGVNFAESSLTTLLPLAFEFSPIYLCRFARLAYTQSFFTTVPVHFLLIFSPLRPGGYQRPGLYLPKVSLLLKYFRRLRNFYRMCIGATPFGLAPCSRLNLERTNLPQNLRLSAIMILT